MSEAKQEPYYSHAVTKPLALVLMQSGSPTSTRCRPKCKSRLRPYRWSPLSQCLAGKRPRRPLAQSTGASNNDDVLVSESRPNPCIGKGRVLGVRPHKTHAEQAYQPRNRSRKAWGWMPTSRVWCRPELTASAAAMVCRLLPAIAQPHLQCGRAYLRSPARGSGDHGRKCVIEPGRAYRPLPSGCASNGPSRPVSD